MLNPSCKLKSTSIFSNAYFCQYQLTCKCNLKKKVNVIYLPAEHQGAKLVQKRLCIPGSNLNLESWFLTSRQRFSDFESIQDKFQKLWVIKDQ